MSVIEKLSVESVEVEDIRFRFPRLGHGSDAINPHTDYSNPYVIVHTAKGDGHGIGFSLGRGNDHICRAVEELSDLIIGQTLEDMVLRFGEFKWILANPVQSRWIAPNAGAYYMAGGAIMNALFDLWAKLEGKPLWRVLTELDPETVAAMIDFRYVEHVLTPTEAVEILKRARTGRESRISALESEGLPCYFTTWIGASTEELMNQIESIRRDRGIHRFKLKVGSSIEHDVERLKSIRDRFGDGIEVYTDANQVWSVPRAIDWMRRLAECDVRWIEEPTAPDSIDGHRMIRESLSEIGIDVVTGENCPNPHLAAQLITGRAVDRFQVDACRMMGPSDVMLVMLIAAKYNVPVCPHAGGSGLDELVPHLAAWNYASCASSLEGVVVEQVGFCSHFFESPSVVKAGRIAVPVSPGYLVGMKREAREKYSFPDGPEWAS